MYDAHFPVGTKKPMLKVSALPRTNSFFCCPKYSLSVVRMEHFAYYRYVHGSRLRHQPKDAVGFLRPDHLIGLKIPYPVAKVGNALGFFEPGFAFLQIPGQGIAGFLCALYFRDVLNGAEQPASLSGCLIVWIS